MMTLAQILRLIDSQEHPRLVDRLLINGRCHSLQARLLLGQPDIAAPVAFGLALQRLCELTYWPHPQGSALAHRLVRLQRRDGTFVAGVESDNGPALAATAVALRGLIDWLAQHDQNRAPHKQENDGLTLIRNSIDRAWRAIAAGFAGARAADHVAWAIVLWQLGDCEDVRLHLPIDQIRRKISSDHATAQTDDLTRLALTMAA